MKNSPAIVPHQPGYRARQAGRVLGLGIVLVGLAVPALESVPTSGGDEEIRLQQVFTSHLPDTMPASAFRLWIHPHLGDLKDYDHLRSNAGVRYGLTRRWEAAAGTDFYFGHGLGEAKFGRKAGLSGVQLATKFNLGRILFAGWDTAVGADFAHPISHPPDEVTDGLRHFGPWATFSRRMESRPAVRMFWGTGIDLVESTRIAGTYGRNQFLDNNARVTAGFVVDRARLHYTFESSVATNRGLTSGHDDVISLRPGIIWESPQKHHLNGRSNLVVGFGLNVQFGPNGNTLGGSLKLRYNLDLKALLGRGRRR